MMRKTQLLLLSVAFCLMLLTCTMLSCTQGPDEPQPDVPGPCIPYENPMLEESLTIAPMSELLPRQGYDLFEDIEVYHIPDEIEDWHFGFRLVMHTGEWQKSHPRAEIEILRTDEGIRDTEDSVDASMLSDKGEALTTISERTKATTFVYYDRRVYHLKMSVLCGEHIVYYELWGDNVGDAEWVYEFITSSEYFQDLLATHQQDDR